MTLERNRDRQEIGRSGCWRFRPDSDNIGRATGWPARGLPSDASPADVPGVWNTALPGYTGAGWYETTFALDRPSPERAEPGRPPPASLTGDERIRRLAFGGCTYLADVWLNGVHLGQHEGGYDAFALRCERALRVGSNRLTLRIVDPPPDGDVDGLRVRECPTAKEPWYGGQGGPWGRPGIWLETLPPVWIEHARVHGDLLGERAAFRLDVRSARVSPSAVRVTANIFSDEASGVESLATPTPATPTLVTPALSHPRGGSNTPSAFDDASPIATAETVVEVGLDGALVDLSVPVPRPSPWSPESPVLYRWRVRLQTAAGDAHERSGALGFRTCELHDGVFSLNGRPRHLKGVLLQPTYPRTLILPPEGFEVRDCRLAQAAGFDLIRCHLRPPTSDLLAAADRAGLMLYVEPPLAWIEPSPRLLEHGQRELRAMVRACANHPSVVLWGIFNENARATEAVGGALLTELAALDPTRPIVENSGGAAVGEVGMWAWGGQSRCWSPGWEAPRPFNDLHIYLASPLRSEARHLLETVGDGSTMDVTPGRSGGERIESRLCSDAVLVSEYGAGGLPDFEAALGAFAAARGPHDAPELADERLIRSFRDDLLVGLHQRSLLDALGSVAGVVRATQTLQAEGALAQTVALRRNPRVSGYVLTQLADAGWEQTAGLAGLWRHPRPVHAAMARANRPRLLHVEPSDPCSFGRTQVRARLIQNPDLAPPAPEGMLSLAVSHALSASAAAPTDAADRDTGAAPPSRAPERPWRRIVRLAPGAVDLGTHALALPPEPGIYEIRATLTTADGWSDTATCHVRRLPAYSTGAPILTDGHSSREHGLPPPPETGAPLHDAPPHRAPVPQRLHRSHATNVPPHHAQSDPGLPPRTLTGILVDIRARVTRRTLEAVRDAAHAGTHVGLLGLEPRSAERVAAVFGLPLAVHGARGNFMGVYHYLRDAPLFAGLGAPCIADSAFAEVLPAWTLDELPGADVAAGCFMMPDGGPGFLWRATVQTLSYGRGRVTLCQLRIGPRRGGALGRELYRRLAEMIGDADVQQNVTEGGKTNGSRFSGRMRPV
ncbi:MAG: hypothetical protein IT305_19550 [Chloroflexi bacterium]|nr:hypothetical protein [Chloroflexota bacterium]